MKTIYFLCLENIPSHKKVNLDALMTYLHMHAFIIRVIMLFCIISTKKLTNWTLLKTKDDAAHLPHQTCSYHIIMCISLCCMNILVINRRMQDTYSHRRNTCAEVQKVSLQCFTNSQQWHTYRVQASSTYRDQFSVYTHRYHKICSAADTSHISASSWTCMNSCCW